MKKTIPAAFVVMVLFPCLVRAQPTMLVYGPTAGGYADSTPGYNVTVWNAAQWSSATTSQFAAFNVIVFGDHSSSSGGPCFTSPTVWNTALANMSVWAPAVTGNVLIIGSDPDYHISNSGVNVQVVQNFVNFAAGGSGTGLYVALSCVYSSGASPGTAVPLLSGFGSFTVESASAKCANQAYIVSASPALKGMTNALLSNWGCSVHEGFDNWPPGFNPLAIATDATDKNYTAPDGTKGLPYILANGVTLIVTPGPTPTFTPTCITQVWPDPFNPKYAIQHLLKIGCITPGTTVAIYTLSGEKVWSAQPSNFQTGSSTALWDGKNQNGSPVAPGVYFYVVSDGDKVLNRGKFLVAADP